MLQHFRPHSLHYLRKTVLSMGFWKQLSSSVLRLFRFQCSFFTVHGSFFFKIVLSDPSWLPWHISCLPCKAALRPLGGEEPGILGYFIGVHSFRYLLHVNGVCFRADLSLWHWVITGHLTQISILVIVCQPHPDSQVCSLLTSTATTPKATFHF